MKKPGSYHRVHTEGSLHVFPYDFGVTEISQLVFSWDNGFPVAKFIYARILFYEEMSGGECLCALAQILIPASVQRHSPPDN